MVLKELQKIKVVQLDEQNPKSVFIPILTPKIHLTHKNNAGFRLASFGIANKNPQTTNMEDCENKVTIAIILNQKELLDRESAMQYWTKRIITNFIFIALYFYF